MEKFSKPIQSETTGKVWLRAGDGFHMARCSKRFLLPLATLWIPRLPLAGLKNHIQKPGGAHQLSEYQAVGGHTSCPIWILKVSVSLNPPQDAQKCHPIPTPQPLLPFFPLRTRLQQKARFQAWRWSQVTPNRAKIGADQFLQGEPSTELGKMVPQIYQ